MSNISIHSVLLRSGLLTLLLAFCGSAAVAQTADELRAEAYRLQTGAQPDFAKAYATYSRAAQAGSVTALNDLGWCLEHGLGVKADSAQAYAQYLEAAKKGDLYGCYNAGRCQLRAIGTERNAAEAAAQLARAANAGNALAQLTLAYYRLYGEQNANEAARLFEQAAQSGLPLAQYAFGCCHFAGDAGLPKDAAKAVQWWQKAAPANADAMYNLAVCYDEGYGMPADSARATELYNNAAKMGQPLAQCRLGQMLLDRYPQQGEKWFRKAYDENNNLPAAGLLGAHLYNQLKQERVQDTEAYDDAFDYLSIAVEQEDRRADIDPEALRLLSACYRLGRGTEPDEQKAAELAQQAAAAGDLKSQQQQGITNGTAYRRPTLPGPQWLMAAVRAAVGQRPQAAEDLCRAAQCGNAEAQYLYGMAHYRNTADRQHYTKAVPWLRVAAAKNYAPALFAVAQCRFNAHGLTRKPAEGVALLQQAASLGYRPACLQLANIFRTGSQGQTADVRQAEDYTQRAAHGLALPPTGYKAPDNTYAQQPASR